LAVSFAVGLAGQRYTLDPMELYVEPQDTKQLKEEFGV
jgi:hypothetical protein